MKVKRLILFGAWLLVAGVYAQTSTPSKKEKDPAIKGWPPEVQRIEIPCSDGTNQPAMWFAPTQAGKKPLLVGLHTWSSHYTTAGGDAMYAEWCLKQQWAFIHPHFRGPNRTPESMGSDRAVQDIVEAVAWAKQHTAVDPDRVYLIGVSGGGHMALQMAGRHPELWAGVSAWCGISDIAQWYREHCKDGKPDKYGRDVEGALGHPPEQNDAEAGKRSPLSSLAAAVKLPLDINAGLHDGRRGSVPFTHSLRAFNTVVPEKDRLSLEDMNQFYATQKIPAHWPAAEPDASYGAWKPVFRKVSNQTRVTVFEGGHEIVHQAALNWLARQRQGQRAIWTIKDFIPLPVGSSQSGK